MEQNNYTEVIKGLILGEVKKRTSEYELQKEFFDTLFFRIKPNIILVAKLIGLQEVDDITLEKYYDTAKREYLSINPIDIDLSSSLTKKGYETWLTFNRKEKIDWDYSNRYFKYLVKNGRSEKVVDETFRSSMNIMEILGDPGSRSEFYIKGLVVGEVQSGKTGNFNGVINRAIDCGYSLIIVLSGIMEDLRSQTQQRVESEVIGEGIDIDTQRPGTKGVGNIDRFGNLGRPEVEQIISITSSKTDFNKSLADADFSLNHTNILVCKKNVSVLKNLIVWLHDYLDQNKDKHNIPLLILDDEADNASLNNIGAKGREYASKINGHIRALLALFKRKTYLGYTATPFANVLQDRNDTPETSWVVKYKVKGETEEKELDRVDNIFPDDFIVLLKPPSNYVGAKQIFETIKPIENKEGEKIPLVHVVNDYIDYFPSRVYNDDEGNTTGVENFTSKDDWNERVGQYNSYLDFDTYRDYRKETRASNKDDGFPKSIPVSLEDAIKCFILSIAIRESRKPKIIHSALYNPHNTMLVHISRFTNCQNSTKDLLIKYVNKIISAINNDIPTSKGSIYFDLENIWYRYYALIVESIRDYLPNDYHDEFMTPIVYDSLKSYLPEAVKGLEVKAINSVTRDKLEYPKTNPKKIIAIGGNRLSRGFTLEGLTINYFVRATNYSDTLLQMGRWFGYRPGYLDCCKIFTTQDSIDKFNSTTRCIEELEGEFVKMVIKNKEPRNFALRVRKHPGTLKITRPSILKNASEVKWSYQDQLEMTTQFDVRKEKIERVWESFKKDIAPQFNIIEEEKGFYKFSTSGEGIIGLLKKENNFRSDDLFQMIKFIDLCIEKRKLTNWTVALKTGGNSTDKYGKGNLYSQESKLPGDIQLSIRRGPKKEQESDWNLFLNKKEFRATGKNANIVSAGKDFSILLSKAEINSAEEEFRNNRMYYFLSKDKNLSKEEAIEKAKKVTIPERVYRERIKEDKGLLVIYLFDSYYSFNQEKGKEHENKEFKRLVEDEKINLEIPLVGYAIGFPPIENDPGGVYMQGDYDLDIDDELEEEEDLPDDKDQV